MAAATSTPPSRVPLPPPPTSETLRSSALTLSPSPGGSPADASRGAGAGSLPLPKARRRSIRPSFSRQRHSSSRGPLGGGTADDDEHEHPKIPTLVPGIRPAYSTPLPVLPMVVLCIAMLSELLSANLSQPFLLKMVEGFFLSAGRPKDSETEAAVGLWTGNLVSVFYITQFFTSLLWSSVADRHGRRAVLVASMLGSACALLTFGTSTSLAEAICVRLCQGIFGGAIGVFRGSIRDLTDETNATRAYAVLGFSWGMGGVIGPILGGVFESPATNFKNTFLGRIELFQRLPFLLPTMMGSSLLFVGATLACFLSWDGGVRGGSRIALPIEKDEPLAAPGVASSSQPPREVTPSPAPIAGPARKRSGYFSPREPELAGSVPHARRDSRASLGTAYGYGGIRSKYPTLAARAAMEAARRVSQAHPELGEDEEEEVGFAQKLLLANEENTFNINDLWVSAAVAQEEVFDDDVSDDDDDDATPLSARIISARRARISSSVYRPAHRASVSGGRRLSSSSGVMPAIFANTGLHTPPVEAVETDPFVDRRAGAGLSAIAERPAATEASPLSPLPHDKAKARWKLLPLLMIVQYGMLSFHDTTHGQIFLSFLITPYRSGGVGLTPAHFSFMVAIMCLCQLFYQFFLYPRLGPPLGRFNHLQMFRLGSCLFIPAYLMLPILHSVANPDQEGGFFVMATLSLCQRHPLLRRHDCVHGRHGARQRHVAARGRRPRQRPRSEHRVVCTVLWPGSGRRYLVGQHQRQPVGLLLWVLGSRVHRRRPAPHVVPPPLMIRNDLPRVRARVRVRVRARVRVTSRRFVHDC
ncbi:hypothetical protein Q5752_000238 [Cryptotrichosporon argae]